MTKKSDRLAVLIDADNVSASIVDGLLEEIAGLGEATVKRIYGDFSSSSVIGPWKDALLRCAIHPIQQFAYTAGKNATDIALIIDAMDLLHSGLYDGFCIVSSDSDFTPLVMRIHESGLPVYGFGEKKTPEPFRNACNKFTYIEVLRKAEATATVSTKVAPCPAAVTPKQEAALPAFVRDVIEKAYDDSGWALLSSVGNYLTKVRSDFDPRLYGCPNSRLSTFVRAFPKQIQIREEKVAGTDMKQIYVRLKG